MSLLKVVMQRLGKMVCLFTTPSMGQVISPQPCANKKPVESGQQTQDAQEQSKPVQSKPKRKPKVVQPTTQAASHKQTQNPVLAVLGQGGLQRQIRASKTNQPAKSAPKVKAKAVKSTKVEALQVPELALVLTPTEAQFGEHGKRKTIASKTPQRAKAAPTKKAKVAVSTTQRKKRTQGKTSAKTPTVRQRKVRGT